MADARGNRDHLAAVSAAATDHAWAVGYPGTHELIRNRGGTNCS